jgi:multimeric flavodoxin WrbA
MKTLILDGSPPGDPMGERIAAALSSILASGGHDVERIVIRDRKIGNCSGCFQCWLKSPGICSLDDDNREISRKVIACDLLVNLTPVTFGVYSPELKRMVDHLISNISPFFHSVHGETHHRQRYDSYPDLLTIGWLDRADADSEAIFRHLAYRNSINFYAKRSASAILYTGQGDSEVAASMKALVSSLDSTPVPIPALPVFSTSSDKRRSVRRAVLLIGSPRMGKSSSAALGGYLFDRLETLGIETERFFLYQMTGDAGKEALMQAAIDRADLTILAFPLYIDSIPAPVLSVMRNISDHRQSVPSSGRFAAIANCGFIEASQNENALAACARFARASGFDWVGSISIGGGEGLVQRTPLEGRGGPLIPVKRSLDLVAAALSAGNAIPEDARKQLSKPFIPAWLYRIAGSMGWKKQARRNGTEKRLNDRPYQPAA